MQWDGYIEVLEDGIQLATISDDGSRFWIDLNGDDLFAPTAPEFVNNNWGRLQGARRGDLSVPLPAGLYRVRIQYEEGYGGNMIYLLSRAEPTVRFAYIIPSDRTPQPGGVENLRAWTLLCHTWYADQMERNGFGRRTFRYETEEDGVTPKVHVIHIPYTAAWLVGDTDTAIFGLLGVLAEQEGIPFGYETEVWFGVPETHVMYPDGTLSGGVAGGGGTGNGDGPGTGFFGSAMLSLASLDGLADDRAYHGHVVPAIGPYPLQYNVSFAWFEGNTFSGLASTWMGAALHEMSHGFGMNHDFRNDGNHGNMMGNGLRNFRGWVLPQRYPQYHTRLDYAGALSLRHNRYFVTPGETRVRDTDLAPVVTSVPGGTLTPVGGLLRLPFTATDDRGLSAALLGDRNGIIAELELDGLQATATFEVPFYEPQTANAFWLFVHDIDGNRTVRDFEVFVNATSNRAPQPFMAVLPPTVAVGQSVRLDATGTSDPDDATSTLRYEFDVDGDGTWDVGPQVSPRHFVTYTTGGCRRVRCRVTDGRGAQSVSTWLTVRVLHPMGDLNCDGVVDTADIDAFVLALVDPAAYETEYPGCDRSLGDTNGDGVVDTADIDGFVSLVVGN